jgi:hypothetical protein
MVESFAPTDSMACSDYNDDDQPGNNMFDLTEVIMDHYIGPLRITNVVWCEAVGAISLTMCDGSIETYLVEIE